MKPSPVTALTPLLRSQQWLLRAHEDVEAESAYLASRPLPLAHSPWPLPVTRPVPLPSAAHAPLIPYRQAVLAPLPWDGMPPVLPHTVHCQGPAQLMSCLVMKSLGSTQPAMEWGGLLASQLECRQLEEPDLEASLYEASAWPAWALT